MARASVKKQPAFVGITFVRERDGIREYKLEKNGLTILLAENHAVPVVGFMVTYHVGSRNEAIGYTGATHLLEHLMFKGSERFNADTGKDTKQFLESRGAYINATTWWDRTNYFEVMPKHILPDAIALEADRMRTARITETDRESEMPVVRNEFERDENLPMSALDKQIWALAFQAHPYHHNTIGWKSDIEGVSIERLQQFYNDFYWPDNATVSVAGDFDADETLTLIKKEFGRHSRNPSEYPRVYTEEPKQEGERRAIVSRAGNNMVGVAHKIPNAHHADMPALLVLMAVLDQGKTSRLYRALVDTALATDVAVACYELHDPALFITYASLTPSATHEEVERTIVKEYGILKEKMVSAAELARAKRLLRTELAKRWDGPYQFLSSLNESIATGDWTHFLTAGEAVMQVTSADVRRVASTYLISDQATVGHFVNIAP
ncbi:MAG: peptidase domain protein [Parcubacteria group bacterium]|nr:peptidase domain protein [Parcubacteria group bacterium]